MIVSSSLTNIPRTQGLNRMALRLPKKLQILEGVQEMRLNEGVVYSLDVSAWNPSTTPSSVVLDIIKEADETDVTNAFIPSGSASVTDNVITLPEIVIPGDASTGDYVVTVQFEAGNISPGRPWFRIQVYE